MDDVTPEFNKTMPKKASDQHPKLVELVRVIARISAKEDYTEHLRKFSDPKEGRPL